MVDRLTLPSLDERTAAVVRVLGVQFALITASIHVWWGAPRAVVYLRVGSIADPRPYLFVLSGAAIFAGVVALYTGAPPKLLYALGIAVMLVYGVGYVWWHVGGHGGLVPGVAGYGHGANAWGELFSTDHLLQPLDLASMLSQIGAIVCFGALYRHESGR